MNQFIYRYQTMMLPIALNNCNVLRFYAINISTKERAGTYYNSERSEKVAGKNEDQKIATSKESMLSISANFIHNLQ
ncbi:hypothetical protein T11_16887 [Trichinella zimbabwensis]|uniref:Uncharacterized protein n=1 Tax=Trichinella zimbabwensis TaxID=268475 RepID=A0A0V1GWZ9_9BILA|nr:hypothetical protein T11_16887 [Trichinella zimbabwensis]